MKELIEAFQIFSKYLTEDDYGFKYPTHCEHDVLYVPGVPYDSVSDEDKKRLSELGFEKSEFEGFQSFRFGSC